MFLALAPRDDHHHFYVNKANHKFTCFLAGASHSKQLYIGWLLLDFTGRGSGTARGVIQLLAVTADMDAPCSASLNCGTEAQLNFKLIWQLCSNHDEGLLVMHEDPEASPWCSKSCSLSVLCGCITHNCLTPSRHGHSVGLDLSSITHHTHILVRCMWVYMCMWWFCWMLTSVCISLYLAGYGHY